MLTRIFTRISKARPYILPSTFQPKGLKPSLIHPSYTLTSTHLISPFFSNENKNPSENKDASEQSENVLKNLDLNDETVRSVFETDLQTISLRFLKAVSATEALSIFTEEIEKKDLGGDELSIAFYFTCYFKTSVSRDPRFKKLIERSFAKLNTMTPLYLFSFIQSLGTYSSLAHFAISKPQQEELAQAILNNKDNFEPEQISEIARSLVQIMPSEQDTEVKDKVFNGLVDALANSKTPASGSNYVNMLFTLIEANTRSGEIVDKLVKIIKDNIERLTGEDLSVVTRLVVALGEMEIKDPTIFFEVYENLVKPQALNFAVDDIANLILVYADKLPDRPHYFMELAKNVHINYPDLTVVGYSNIWLALAKYRMKVEQVEKTLQLLKQIPVKSSLWKMKDVEAYDLINIIISTFTLGLNNKEFMKLLTDNLENRFEELDNGSLVAVARVFTMKAADNKDFYLKIYNECCVRAQQFNSQEKKILKDTFSKSQLGSELPPSPFV